MSGRVVHFEIPFDDEERARSFYRDVFEWQIQPMPEMEYTIVGTGPADENGMPAAPGYIGGGMMQRQELVDRPVITLDVEDIDATLAAVVSHGGKAATEKMPVGTMGFIAYFHDSEGNLMGLWQTAT